MTEEVSTTNGEDFDLLVKKKNDELQPLLRRMEEAKQLFINEVVRFTIKWYGETTRLYVEKQSEITLHMSKEKLASMKNSVNSLIGNAQEKVNTALSKPDVWWHIAPAKNQQLGMYEQLDNRFPEVVDKAVRRALGELGRILEQFGYRVSIGGPNKWSYPEFWFETHKELGTAVQPFYPLLPMGWY